MSVQEENLLSVAKALRNKGHQGDICAKEFYFKVNQLPRMTPFSGQVLPWVGSAAYQAVAVARTYWEARVCGMRKFKYSGGYTFYNEEQLYFHPSGAQRRGLYAQPLCHRQSIGWCPPEGFVRLGR